jgi:carbamoyltransferase
MTHAFYCGTPPSGVDIAGALAVDDVASQRIGDISTAEGRDAIADLMAFMVARSGVIALYQGAAETGPRALGHRSILANPCDAEARRLNKRVKYRRPSVRWRRWRRWSRARLFPCTARRMATAAPVTTWC